MEEVTNREQLSPEQANVSGETVIESVDSGDGSLKDSGLGKFKSPEALYEAYKALEAEFTRKSQKLSELEKDKTEKTTVSEEKIDNELSLFLSKRSEAAPYATELKNLSMAQGGRVDFDDMLSKLLIDKLASGQSKMDNPIIKKYVFQDEELKNHVIESYMRELKQGQPPHVISGDRGEKVTGQKPVTPKSLAEAKKMVEDLFT